MKHKFFFATGVAGSGWSMMTQHVKKVFRSKFDESDENDLKQYFLPKHLLGEYTINDPNWMASTHHGVYYGPYQEYGNDFDDLTKYNNRVAEFHEECLRPYSTEQRPCKLIKCHWFSYSLDWLWENCKGHSMILMYRDSDIAEDWWYRMGGWDIQHPPYTWYETPEKLSKHIREENKLILDFAERKNIQWYDFDCYGQWMTKRFNITIPEGKVPEAVPNLADKPRIAVFDIV